MPRSSSSGARAEGEDYQAMTDGHGSPIANPCPGCGHDTADHMRDAGGCLSAQDWRDTNDIVCGCPMFFDDSSKARADGQRDGEGA